AADVADAWFDLAENGALAATGATALANAQRTEAITAARVRSGRAAAADLARAEAARLGFAERLDALAAERTRIAARLALLAGVPAPAFATPEPPADALAAATATPVLPLAALAARPDVRASELRLAASGLRVEEARAALYPALTLGGGLTSVATAVGRALDPANWIGGLALTGAQPLVDGGARRARLAGRAAEQMQALAAHRRVLLAAAGEAETALSDLRRAEARLALAEAQAARSEAVVRAARSRLAAGAAALADVLEDEQRRVGDRERVVTLQRERARAAVAAIRAAGGWDV
ncbi:MAG: TolC family protein, partial [Alphaproteobacteria bacterium]|nr:TolC family protein [Alphaproteobacteria bacterium]